MYLPVALALIAQVCHVHGYITYIAARLPLQGERAKPGSPWPQPVTMRETDHVFSIDQSAFPMTSDFEQCDIVAKGLKRYRKLFFEKQLKSSGTDKVHGLEIKVKGHDCPKYPSFGMDESYVLNVTSSIVIEANTVWGVLRGLETLSQLIYTEQDTYKIRETYIQDSPRFKHRGSMFDTARHYLPLPIIYKQIDAMSYNKLNVFHWHIIDDQSFPYVSTTFPQLSKMGAFSPKHIYTQQNVADVIEYARMRGIRVIPEFDTPGHAEGWGRAFKELLTPCWYKGVPGTAEYGQHADYENLDPTQNATYDFLSEFFTEVKDVFKDDFLHMGMDETHHMCWESSPNISEFMTQMGFQSTEYYKLEQYFDNRLLDIISGLGKRYIVWQDPLDNGAKVAKSSLVQIWKGGDTDWRGFMQNITKLDYDVLLSSCWYLNYISYGEDWVKYYKCDPLDFKGTPQQKKKVLGGEMCMWMEYVDGTNFLSRYWPRASAAAERLWSPASVNDVDTARFRLDQHRCRMLRRGIPAEPVLPGFCGDYDYGFPEEPEKEPTSAPVPVCTGSCSSAMLDLNLLWFLIISLTLMKTLYCE